jgi:hypothetical protein
MCAYARRAHVGWAGSRTCCRKGSVWSVVEMSTMGMVGSVIAKTASKSSSCSAAGTQLGPRYSRTAAWAAATKPRGCKHLWQPDRQAGCAQGSGRRCRELDPAKR